MNCEHENKMIVTAFQCSECGEFFNRMHERQQEKTNISDGNGRVFLEGDIVDFNPIGNTSVYKGTIKWQDFGKKYIIREIGTLREWAIEEIFSNPKYVGSIYNR